MVVLLRILGGAGLIYLLVCAAMFLFQRQLQYAPNSATVDPATVGLPMFTAESVRTPDGTDIVVWWKPPAERVDAAVLYLHGNAGNLASRAERFRLMIEGGTGVLAVSWRGYGGSGGSPSEEGFRQDARAAYDLLASRLGADRIIIMGESIGTTIATMLAADVPSAGLVLDAGFTSTLAIAEGTYPFLPVSWLMLDQMRADLAAPKVTVPVFMVHCTGDSVIPLRHAEALAQLFPNPPDFLPIPAECHPARFLDYREPFRDFVLSLGARQAG